MGTAAAVTFLTTSLFGFGRVTTASPPAGRLSGSAEDGDALNAKDM
jgi:hypothetical protein